MLIVKLKTPLRPGNVTRATSLIRECTYFSQTPKTESYPQSISSASTSHKSSKHDHLCSPNITSKTHTRLFHKGTLLQKTLPTRTRKFPTERLPENANGSGDLGGRKYRQVPLDEDEQDEERKTLPRQSRTYSTETLPENADIFGDLGGRQYRRVPLDEDKQDEDKKTLPDQSRTYSTEPLPERADVFGDLGGRKYERVPLDEDEEEEEEFTKNEARVPRRLKPSAGQYATMIKEHIGSGNLQAALGVLDQLKTDRSKPTNYMYNLLIRAFAVQGIMPKAFSLYNQMKKRDLKVTPATYTSLFNACANYNNSERAVEKLNSLRQSLLEKQYPLNVANYNAMVKAYGRHGKILQAFEVVDEMRDNQIPIGEETFNFLLQAAISDKNAGFRHALVVWHLMQRQNLKPSIYTYNLLLRAARDCKLGDLKIQDFLISGEEKSQVGMVDGGRPDLLASPPVLSTLMITAAGLQTGNHKRSNDLESNLELQAEVDDSTNESEERQNPVIDSTPKNHLLLLGGFESVVQRMEEDGVLLDIKTITVLMDLVPGTEAAEKRVINYAKKKGIPLDVDFYNMLIKKRCMRFDYDSGKDVLHYLQRDDLEPNIITWGVLAMGCKNAEQAKELIQGMEMTGHTLNIEVIGTLLNSACRRWQFGLILELIQIMRTRNLKPNKQIFEALDSFQKRAHQMMKNKNKQEWVKQSFWQNGFRKFNLRYSSWRTDMGLKVEQQH